MNKEKKRPIGLSLAALLLVLVVLFCALMIVGSCLSYKQTEPERVSRTVVHDGVEYFPRQDMDVLLVMGIDKEGVVEESNSYNNDGATDALILVILDHGQRKVRLLNINRDTMTQVPVLGIGGKQAGTIKQQIALAHTYGSGLEDSCENTRAAVSELLGDVRIDYYVAVHLDAIAIVNDAVGGVTVEVTDDFNASDAKIPMGEVTLQGQQAIDYVRYRKNVGDELNLSRMQRQQIYMDGFFAALHEKMEDSSAFAYDTYDRISEYMVTDCSATVMSSMLERYGDYELDEIYTLAGANHVGEEFMEFYPDEEALQDLVLELFYAPK